MIYILKNKKMPWGSYGEMLWQGIYYFNKKKKQHCISRTAPFCPKIYRSQYDSQMPVVIIKEDVKNLIENHFTDLNFTEIYKEKIVKIDWQDWDLSADEPTIYPSGDMDAEEYIVHRKHCESLSEEMGKLYALIPDKEGYAYYDEKDNKEKLVKSTLSEKDIFVANSLKDQHIYVSEKIKSFLESNFQNEIYFEPLILAEPKNLHEIKETFLNLDLLKEKSDKMTTKDWQNWHGLKRYAEKLIEGIDDLKTDRAKNKRRTKIESLLNQANEIYPLNYEEWMYGFLK